MAPGAILFYFFWVRDRWQREPWKLLAMLAFWGGVSVIPAGAVELAYFGLEMKMESIKDAAVAAFLCAALVEESIKFLFVFFMTHRSKYFTEEYDGIIYAVAVGLGFAVAENFLYVVGAFFMEEGWIQIAVMRAFTAVPMHALDGVILGYFIGRAHFMKDRVKGALTLLLGLFVAILFHGVYDFFAFLSAVVPKQAIGFCLVGLFWVMVVQWGTVQRMVRNAQRRTRQQHIATAAAMESGAFGQAAQMIPDAPDTYSRPEKTGRNFCRYCGKPVLPSDKFCRNCGEAL